jgi:hypothetical protein
MIRFVILLIKITLFQGGLEIVKNDKKEIVVEPIEFEIKKNANLDWVERNLEFDGLPEMEDDIENRRRNGGDNHQ